MASSLLHYLILWWSLKIQLTILVFNDWEVHSHFNNIIHLQNDSSLSISPRKVPFTWVMTPFADNDLFNDSRFNSHFTNKIHLQNDSSFLISPRKGPFANSWLYFWLWLVHALLSWCAISSFMPLMVWSLLVFSCSARVTAISMSSMSFLKLEAIV